MERKLSEMSVAKELGKALRKRLANGCIRDLQGMKDVLLSGDDTCLENVWDEICVQQQGEESYAWDTYLDIVSTFVEARVDNLKAYELDALWLLTPEGDDWYYESDEERDRYPVSKTDIINYLREEILSQAMNWNNERIRRYLDGSYENDDPW